MIMKMLLLIQKSLKSSATSGTFGYFYSHLILETVFPAFKLTPNCYVSKYKHILFLKTGNLILNWVPLSFFYKHPMPERLSSFFSELGIIWKYNLGLCSKTETIFHLFFLNLEKLGCPARATLKKFENLFVNWEKLGSTD